VIENFRTTGAGESIQCATAKNSGEKTIYEKWNGHFPDWKRKE
jgi:hypothetical protein